MAADPGLVHFLRYGGDRSRLGRLLEASGLTGCISDWRSRRKAGQGSDACTILIKPNIVNDSPPPITTPCWVVEEIAAFLEESVPGCRIVIADGTGEVDRYTMELFRLHGYLDALAGCEFIDLNLEPCRYVPIQGGRRWDGLYLPEILFHAFVISVPVLKAHTLAGVTLSMKNMIGACPPEHYQEGGHWKKSAFHTRIQASIFDLNLARSPDFAVLDATVGMAESHLGGPTCTPPVDILAAGSDPAAMDAYGAGLLGLRWKDIGHIRMADGIIGKASNFKVLEAA